MSKKALLALVLVAAAAAIAYYFFFKKSGAASQASKLPAGLGADDDAAFAQALAVIKQYTPPGDVAWIIEDFNKRMTGELPMNPDDTIGGIPSKALVLLSTYSAEFWGPAYHGDGGTPGTSGANYSYIGGGTNDIVGTKIWSIAQAFRTKMLLKSYGTAQ